MSEVKKLTDSTEKLRLLRLWLANQYSNDGDIGIIIDEALNELIISTSKELITLDTLVELSAQLPFVKNPSFKDELFYKLKRVQHNLEDGGLSRNIIIYELNMFHCQFSVDPLNSIDTLNELIKKIKSFDDTLIQLECFTHIYTKLKIIHDIRLKSQFNYSYTMINRLAEEILKNTGDHLKLLTHALNILGKYDIDISLSIISKLNLQYRREEARLLILSAYLENSIKRIDFNQLNEISQSFEIKNNKEKYYINVLERLAESKSLPYIVVKKVIPFISEILNFKSKNKKVKGYLLLYKILNKNSRWALDSKNKDIKKFLVDAFNNMDVIWEQIDYGYLMSSELSSIDKETAHDFFTKSSLLRENNWLNTSSVADMYILCIRLLIQASNNLIKTKNFSQEYLREFSSVIDKVPSDKIRLEIWTELSFNAYLSNSKELSEILYDQFIFPIFQSVIKSNIKLSLLSNPITLIYLYHDSYIENILKDVDYSIVEEIYYYICHFLISNKNPYNLYEDNRGNESQSYTNIDKSIKVLSKINTDHIFYDLLNYICNTIQISIKYNKISKVQHEDLCNQLNELVEAKLPDNNNIKHDGYKLISRAKIFAINKYSNKNKKVFWIELITNAKTIPNMSDRIFVLSDILGNLPDEFLEERSILFNDIVNGLGLLKSHYEYIQRVNDISKNMYDANRNSWKEIIKNAFSLCLNLDDESEKYNNQKKMLDTLYRIDDVFAKELLSVISKKDPSYKWNRRLKNHYEMLEISKKIKRDETLEEKEKINYSFIVGGIVKAIKSLNSNLISPKKLPNIVQYFNYSYINNITDSYPVYLYYLMNCNNIYTHKKGSDNEININVDNFNILLKATKLVEILSNKKTFFDKSTNISLVADNAQSNRAVTAGSRDEILSIIRQWMEDEVEDFVIIADSYFKKEDIQILKIINGLAKNNLYIDILASKDKDNVNLESEFRKYWDTISEDEPPFTNITFCQNTETASPFHDRWIISKNGGIRMGTSINSLGIGRESEISIMNAAEANEIKEKILDDLISRRRASFNGSKLLYKSFTL